MIAREDRIQSRLRGAQYVSSKRPSATLLANEYIGGVRSKRWTLVLPSQLYPQMQVRPSSLHKAIYHKPSFLPKVQVDELLPDPHHLFQL